MTLGEKLAAARQAKGLTQAQAAGDVITRNMLSLLEHDQAKPSLSTLRHLARTLEVPLSWLLDGGGEALEAARTAFLAGDWKRCLDILAAETTPLTEEGQLLRLRAALRAAREALERGDPEAGAPLLDQAGGWLPATAYATPWEAAELARLRLRLALDRGLTPEDQRAWEASAAPAEAARQLLLARCALAQGKLREASQARRRADGAPEAGRGLLQGLLVLLPGQLPHLRVLHQLLGLIPGLHRPLVGPEGVHQGLEFGLLLVQPGHQGRVVIGLGGGQPRLDLAVFRLDGGQFVQHGKTSKGFSFVTSGPTGPEGGT